MEWRLDDSFGISVTDETRERSECYLCESEAAAKGSQPEWKSPLRCGDDTKKWQVIYRLLYVRKRCMIVQKHILLVEDDDAIREMVENYLTMEGFLVTSAENGEEAVQSCLNNSFDLAILDIMIPKLNGLEVLKIIREQASLPIIIMSAKDSDVDKALGLGLGADDYIAKPFSMLEFSARVKAAIRRATKYSSQVEEKKDIVEIANLSIDLVNFQLRRMDSK